MRFLHFSHRSLLFPCIAALTACISFFLLHWQGIALTPDGWAYWQGAVSLANGNGYTYFSGNSITAWPPLYSLYLSCWVWLMGPSGLSLVNAQALLICIQAFVWMYVLLSINSNQKIPKLLVFCTAFYVGLLLSLTQQLVMASTLQYIFLPIFLLSIHHINQYKNTTTLTRWLIVGTLCGSLLMLTHNSSIAFIGAGVLILLCAKKRTIMAAVIIGIIPLIIWLIVRHVLHQQSSHTIGIGVGRYSAISYLLQMLHSIGLLITPINYGAPYVFVTLLFMLTSIIMKKDKNIYFISLFVFLSTFFTYVLFNISHINDPIGTRYVIFVPLILLPLLSFALMQSSFSWRKIGTTLIVVLTLLPTLNWTVGWARRSITNTVDVLGFPQNFLPHRAQISPHYRQGPPIETDNGLWVAPITWEER